MKGLKVLTAINLVVTLLLCCCVLYVAADPAYGETGEIKVYPLEYASAAPETTQTSATEPTQAPTTLPTDPTEPTTAPTAPSEPTEAPDEPTDGEDALPPADGYQEPPAGDENGEETTVQDEDKENVESDGPKAEEPEVDEPKVEEPKVEEPKVEEPTEPEVTEPVEPEGEPVEPNDEPIEDPNTSDDPAQDEKSDEGHDHSTNNDHKCDGDHKYGTPCVESYTAGTFEYIRVDTCEVCGYTVRSHWMIIPRADPCPDLTLNSTDIFLGILEEFYPSP